MSKALRFLAAVILAGLAGSALAQHKHSHPLKSHHGGEVLEGRRHHFELVLLPAQDPGSVELSLYVTNHHNRAVKLAAATAQALVRAKGAEVRVPLALTGGNVLKGVAQFEADPALSVELTITIGKLPPETLTFRPLEPKRR